MKPLFYLLFFSVLLTALQSCQDNFLDAKPRTELLVPKTLEDLERLLANEGMLDQTPGLGELSTDDFYLTTDYWQSLNPVERNAYIWASDIYEGTAGWHDWNNAYVQVFYSNIVLETLRGIPQTDVNRGHWRRLKGHALFLRAYAYHGLSQVFVPMYDVARMDEPWGLPLKYTTALDESMARSTVGETYGLILNDLQEAVSLLAEHHTITNPSIPTKTTAYAALSRVYLSMGKYPEAGLYADSSLLFHDELLDYTELNTESHNPFPFMNPEVLYSSKVNANLGMLYGTNRNAYIHDALYMSYKNGDIRKQVFFRLTNDLPSVKYGYYAMIYRFTGLTTAEMYLNRAEAAARSGDVMQALTDINTLLRMRYSSEDFEPHVTASPDEALAIVLAERRKELCFRGLRWTDLRRLNQEGAGIVLTRELNGQTYTLSPQSSRYTFPVPLNAVINSNITQYERTDD